MVQHGSQPVRAGYFTTLRWVVVLFGVSLFGCVANSDNPTIKSTQFTATILTPKQSISIQAGEAIHFSAEVRNIAHLDQISYIWRFGDGQTSPNKDPEDHTYNIPGKYTVTFLATDTASFVSTPAAKRTITVIQANTSVGGGNQPPNGIIRSTPIASNGKISILTGESVTFACDGTDPDNDSITACQWLFPGGDPATLNRLDPVTVRYSANGTYTTRLTVTDSQGNVDPTPATIQVEVSDTPIGNRPPDGSITSTPAARGGKISIATGASVEFTCGGTDPDGNSFTCQWDFPGGSPSTSNSLDPVVVSYGTAGTYDATLTITDSQSTPDPLPATVQVQVSDTPIGNRPPDGAITSTPAASNGTITIPSNASIEFTCGGTDPDGNSFTCQWDFPGGNPASINSLNPTAVTYATPGTYSATLTVTDSQNAADPSPATVQVVVTNQPPNGAITSTPSASNGKITVFTGDNIEFSCSGTDPENDPLATCQWQLPGASTTAVNSLNAFTVNYVTANTYSVSLTVTDNQNNSDLTPATVEVVVTDKPTDTVISFVILNDLHAHLVPHNDFIRNSDGSLTLVQRGGVARIATMINTIKLENPNHNIVMNIGDTFHGGVEAFYSLGNDIVEVINMLNIDVGVPGNWDFIYGPLVTRTRFTNANFRSDILETAYPDLAANITVAVNNFQATWSKNINGVQVGVIGISSDIVSRMHPVLASNMTILQTKNEYINLINQLSQQLRNPSIGNTPADIVVVMSELGIHKDLSLADAIDTGSVDVFFSAHTHELVTTPLSSTSGAAVVEAGNDTYLGRMDITWDATNKVVANKKWTVLPVELSIAEDTAVRDKINTVRAPYLAATVNKTDPSPYPSGQTLTRPINTVLATTNRVLSRRHSLENSFNNLITDLLRRQYGTQIAMTPGFRFDTVLEDGSIATGNITLEDVYRFIPVGYQLATANVTGARLKQVIEENLTSVYSTTIFNQFGGWFDGFSGMDININLSQPDGNRLQSLVLPNTMGGGGHGGGGGGTIANNAILSIVGCIRPFDNPGTLCSYTGFTSVTPITNAGQTSNLTMIDFLSNALSNTNLTGPNAPVARTNVNDSSATLLWPQGEYLQPIRGVP